MKLLQKIRQKRESLSWKEFKIKLSYWNQIQQRLSSFYIWSPWHHCLTFQNPKTLKFKSLEHFQKYRFLLTPIILWNVFYFIHTYSTLLFTSAYIKVWFLKILKNASDKKLKPIRLLEIVTFLEKCCKDFRLLNRGKGSWLKCWQVTEGRRAAAPISFWKSLSLKLIYLRQKQFLVTILNFFKSYRVAAFSHVFKWLFSN